MNGILKNKEIEANHKIKELQVCMGMSKIATHLEGNIVTMPSLWNFLFSSCDMCMLSMIVTPTL